MIYLFLENLIFHTECRRYCVGIVGEKGIRLESVTITVAVYIEVFIFVGESRSLGKPEKAEYKNAELNVLYNVSRKTCFDTVSVWERFFRQQKFRFLVAFLFADCE